MFTDFRTIAKWVVCALAASLAMGVAIGPATSQAGVRGQVTISGPSSPGRLASGSPTAQFLFVFSFGVGSVRAPAPTGPLATSIYTTDRTLLPSIIGKPMATPLRRSINAQRTIGAGPITASGGTARPLPPLPATSSTTRLYTDAGPLAAVSFSPGQYVPNAPQTAAASAAMAYLWTITAESESSLADSHKPVTSLAPADEGLLRDNMLKGERAFRREDYAQAMRSFRLANDLSLNSPETMLSRFHARFAMATDSYSAPAYLLARVLRTMPELPLVPLQPKEFYGQVRHYSDRLAGLEEHCQRSNARVEALLVLAYFKWFDGDVDAAVFEANALRGQLAEAQGKLAAVDKELHTVSCRSKKTCEHAVCGLARRVARILKEEK